MSESTEADIRAFIEAGTLPTVGKLAGPNGHYLLDRADVLELAAKRSRMAA